MKRPKQPPSGLDMEFAHEMALTEWEKLPLANRQLLAHHFRNMSQLAWVSFWARLDVPA